MRSRTQSTFEAGQHSGGKREEHHHGSPCHIQLKHFCYGNCVQVWRFIGFHTLPPNTDWSHVEGFMDRRGQHFPAASPKSWKSQLYTGVNNRLLENENRVRSPVRLCSLLTPTRLPHCSAFFRELLIKEERSWPNTSSLPTVPFFCFFLRDRQTNCLA